MQTKPAYKAGTVLGADDGALPDLVGKNGPLAFSSMPASLPMVRLACAKIPCEMPEASMYRPQINPS